MANPVELPQTTPQTRKHASDSGKHSRSSLCTHSTLKSHPIADLDLKWLHILLCIYKWGSLKQVLAINNSVCSKVTAGGTAFKRFISLLVTHPEFSEHGPCSHTLSGDPFSLSWQCFLEIQGEKNGTWSDLHIRNSKMLLNSLKHKPHLSSSRFSVHIWSPLSLENNVVFLFKAGFCCPLCNSQALYQFHWHETKLKTIRPDLV